MLMEKPREIIKTINGGAGALQLEPSLSYVSFPHQKSIPSRAEVSADDQDNEISIFDAQRYFNEGNGGADASSRVCKRVSPINLPNLSRISTDGSCNLAALSRFSSASSATDGYGGYGKAYRVRSFHATPTASSEASWNSQTGLLSNPPGAIAVSMTMKNQAIDDKKKGSSTGKIKWFWGRRCPCSGKKSVQVEPKTPLSLNQKVKLEEEQKISSVTSSSWGDHKREEMLLACNIPRRISAETQFPSPTIGQRVVAVASAKARPLVINDGSVAAAGFTFPILNQHPVSAHVKMAAVEDDDPARDSLEVFRPFDESSSISVSKKLTSRINNTMTDDDVASDTSSDLFEIESFSTTTQSQTTPFPMFHRRDSLDESTSSFNARRAMMAVTAATTNGSSTPTGYVGCPYSPMGMTTECYEPSEASIDWSVTTAEGFERGSVGVSEAGEAMAVMMSSSGRGGKKKSSGGNGGLLLSCRCEKAVSVVGPNPVKYLPHQGPAAATSKHVVGNVNKPPLARMSLRFAA